MIVSTKEKSFWVQSKQGYIDWLIDWLIDNCHLGDGRYALSATFASRQFLSFIPLLKILPTSMIFSYTPYGPDIQYSIFMFKE